MPGVSDPSAMPRGIRALVWVILVVLFGLLPVLMFTIHAWNRGQAPNFGEIVRRGDLLLLATAIAGGCLYGILPGLRHGIKSSSDWSRVVLAAGLILVSVIAAGWYADLASLSGSESVTVTGTALNSLTAAANAGPPVAVAVLTPTILIITVILGLFSELLIAEADRS